MRDVLEDLHTLTTIPKNSLVKIFDKCKYAICNNVYEAMVSGENVVDMNIGIGTLKIKFDDDGVLYKFIPSKSLEESISNTITLGENPLCNVIEQSLVNKVENAHKELF